MNQDYVFFVKNSHRNCFLCVIIFLLLCSKSNAQSNTFELIAQRVDKITLTQRAESQKLIKELYEIAYKSPDSLLLIPQCIYRESTWVFQQGIKDSTLTTLVKHYLNQVDKNSFEDAILHYSLTLNHIAEGSYVDAFLSGLHALQIFEKQKDSLFTAKTLGALGNICGHVNMLANSYEYYERALKLVHKDQPEYYQFRCNYFLIYFSDGQIERCRDSLLSLTNSFKNQPDIGLRTILYLNLALISSQLNDKEMSLYCCNTINDLIKSIDNKKFVVALYQNFAIYYFNTNNYQKSVDYLNLAIQVAKEYNILPSLSVAYYNMSFVYSKLGDANSAYFYLTKHLEIMNDQNKSAQAIAAYHAYISALLESSENKLVIAEQEIVLKNRRFVIFIILAVAVIVVIILFLVVLHQQKQNINQQKRLKEAENKELAAQLSHEKKIQELKEEQHVKDIASKTREITSSSLQLSNKNNILKQISNLSQELSGDGKNAKEISKQINHIIKNNLNTDNEWKTFKLHFDNVHPRFFDHLKEMYSDLTENNLRMCAYFRIGMSTKQIAHIMSIAPESVSTHRHRLKKKFGLTEEQDLDDFIRNI